MKAYFYSSLRLYSNHAQFCLGILYETIFSEYYTKFKMFVIVNSKVQFERFGLQFSRTGQILSQIYFSQPSRIWSV
mgnify:CR=1 FL=1